MFCKNFNHNFVILKVKVMKKLFKLIKSIIFFCIAALIAICGYIVYDGYNMYKEAISSESIESKIAKIENRQDYLSYDEIPKDFSNAIVAVEDRRFYMHGGYDIKSIARAFVKNIETKSLVEGGSTITQQLAKNLYFSFEKKFTRKVAELFVAIDIEKKYTKEQILSYYISVIYFGDGYYGLEAASLGYFSKRPDRLNFDEITLLAGLPNAPSMYALTNNPDLARKRQAIVIEQMKECGYITDDNLKEINEK